MLKNCTCRGGFTGRYIDFENAAFYRDTRHFNVAQWLWAATALGAFPAIISLGFSIFLLRTLRPLWKELPKSGKPSGQANGAHATAGNVQGGLGGAPAMLNADGANVEPALLTNGHSPGRKKYVHKIDMCWLG